MSLLILSPEFARKSHFERYQACKSDKIGSHHSRIREFDEGMCVSFAILDGFILVFLAHISQKNSAEQDRCKSFVQRWMKRSRGTELKREKKKY